MTVLDLETYPHPGFGVVTLHRDGVEPEWWRVLSPAEIEDVSLGEIEANVAVDPDHQWRLTIEAPLYSMVCERKGIGRWIITDIGDGFA